jgi:hypothetical protein
MQPVRVRQPLQPVFAEPIEAKRRDLFAGASLAVAGSSVKSAHAAYGESANVFGGVTNPSAFVPFAGDGFSLLLPAKWNPSKEQDLPNIVLRFEDNFDAVNNLAVMREKTDKGKIEDFGNPEKFLQDHTYLLGQQSYAGQTISEGGFAPNRVSAASVLDVATDTDKKGRNVYKYNILCRTADGNEGGRHQLISATVASGQLYILRIQVGDKRWFKGTKKEAEGTFNSFSPA